MNEHDEPGDVEGARDTAITPETGSLGIRGEGIITHVQGPTLDVIRTSDRRGWNAAADITDGMIETATASGIKSEGEHLTLDTAETLVRRLNADGATWGQPIQLPEGDGDDFETRDARDARRAPLRGQVTRPKMPEGFWAGISAGSTVPPGPAADAARSMWHAVENKHLAARWNVVLALNAIRTPWFALPSVVKAFRERYGEAASREGWAAIWVVGVNETFTARLDHASDTE